MQVLVNYVMHGWLKFGGQSAAEAGCDRGPGLRLGRLATMWPGQMQGGAAAPETG